MAPNSRLAGVCSECGARLAETNFLDPMSTLFEQGVAHSKAVYRPTKPIVVITVWLLSLPALIGSLFGVAAAFEMPGFTGFVFFWLFVGIAALSATAIYKVTTNYRRRESPEDLIDR